MALRPARVLPQTPFITQHDTIWGALGRLAGGQLYQHQVDAVRAIRQDFGNPNPNHGIHQNVSLAVLPTGTGKSGVAVLAAYCCNVAKVLVVTPSITVASQIFADFQDDGRHNPPFLERRNIFTRADRPQYMPYGALIRRTEDVNAALDVAPLVVINAQKFGAQSRVNLEDVPRHFSLVIIDEAHHYPARTWLDIVRHFSNSNILFLTATPFHKNAAGKQEYILGEKMPCYQLTRERAIQQHIIRPTRFIEVRGGSTRDDKIKAVLEKMRETLEDHDNNHPNFRHQGLILASDIPEANRIADMWPERCMAYVAGSPPSVLVNFLEGRLDVLVIIYRLTEGFDRKNVSVVGILRNVQPASRVYFSQFVGRAVRKLDANDNVTATVISHEVHNQQQNYYVFEQEHTFVAEDDPVEDPAELDGREPAVDGNVAMEH